VTANTLTLGGTLTAATMTINSGAKALGVMTINANVTNSGTLLEDSLVMSGGVQGVLKINGNYTQTSTGTLNFLIGGTTAGTGYDQLQITGTATLGGTLSVSAVSGYTVPTGQTFALLTFGSSSGSFGTVSNYTGTSMTPQYNSTGFNMLSWADDLFLPSPRPSPSTGEGEQGSAPAPPLPPWERGLGGEGEEGVLVAATQEDARQLRNDLVFTALAEADEVPLPAVWQDGPGLEELLELPLTLLEELLELVA
jgi:hypothetical protein